MGVLFHYANVKFVNDSPTGRVLNETPYVHFKLTAECVVFRPITFKRLAMSKQAAVATPSSGTSTGNATLQSVVQPEQDGEDIVLSATVNKVSSGHVGLLILSKFNASIPQPSLTGYEFDEEEECWRNDETGDELRDGSVVRFVGESVRHVKGILDLEGRLA
jgi:hypothetical protein